MQEKLDRERSQSEEDKEDAQMGATITRLDVGGHFRTTCRTLRRENFLGLLLRKGAPWFKLWKEYDGVNSSPPGRRGSKRRTPHSLDVR
jgi:hypothetical protein